MEMIYHYLSFFSISHYENDLTNWDELPNLHCSWRNIVWLVYLFPYFYQLLLSQFMMLSYARIAINLIFITVKQWIWTNFLHLFYVLFICCRSFLLQFFLVHTFNPSLAAATLSGESIWMEGMDLPNPRTEVTAAIWMRQFMW